MNRLQPLTRNLNPLIRLMRLHKPIGIWLLFFPAAWGLLLAPGPLRWDLLAVLLLGAAITRSAGCILNDLTDRKLDAQVERTRSRPLASGELTTTDAVLLLLVLAMNALLLAVVLPRSVTWIALAAAPMIAAYPWMKRLTFWPQAFLGLTFNLGALIGWAASGASVALAALLLYAACFFWTLGYDTLYAVEDMQDDARAGIKSTARRIGTGAKLAWFTAVCYGCMLALFAAALYFAGGWAWPTELALALAAGHAAWQVAHARRLVPSSSQAGVLFRSNQWLGLVLLVGLLLHRAFPYLS